MGWFFGDKQDPDPTKHLDPKLKEFLKKETPDEYIPALKPPEPPQSSLDKVLPPGPSSNTEQTPDSDKPRVPPESQFQDGRYADLWKTYVPLHQVEGLQNMDKMRQVVEAHKDRQYLLGKAALENCAEEHMLVSTCFATGGMRARMTMCKKENSQFARCYEMQSKFLKALGYASMSNQDTQTAERIQMHADTLYHRMLDYEASVKEAQEKGLEPPAPKPLFTPDAEEASSFPVDEKNRHQKIPPSMLHKIAKPLQKMTPLEQEVEVRALKGEMRVLGAHFDEIEGTLLDEKFKKQKRKDKMAGWVGEWAADWIIP